MLKLIYTPVWRQHMNFNVFSLFQTKRSVYIYLKLYMHVIKMIFYLKIDVTCTCTQILLHYIYIINAAYFRLLEITSIVILEQCSFFQHVYYVYFVFMSSCPRVLMQNSNRKTEFWWKISRTFIFNYFPPFRRKRKW